MQGAGFRVQGAGCRAQGAGCGVRLRDEVDEVGVVELEGVVRPGEVVP